MRDDPGATEITVRAGRSVRMSVNGRVLDLPGDWTAVIASAVRFGTASVAGPPSVAAPFTT